MLIINRSPKVANSVEDHAAFSTGFSSQGKFKISESEIMFEGRFHRISGKGASRLPVATIASKRKSGFSIVEVMVGASVVAIGFIGIWMALAQCLNVARAHRETIAATECLMQRAEESRAVGWTNLTSASGIQNNIFTAPPANAAALPNLQETISVSIYPPVTPAQSPIKVQRNSDGTVQAISHPPAQTLRSILAVRVDFSVSWKNAQSGRQRLRQMSTVIALGGLLH